MELLLFRPLDFQREYNCSRVNVEDVPLAERQNVWNGIALMFLFFLLELLYVPCMWAIWKRMASNSFYQFLFFVGCTDMTVLWVCGFFTGLFTLRGDVFCSDPVFIYVLGTLGMAFWAAESVAGLNLAINRCLAMTYPEIGEKIYGGIRTPIWLLIATVYALYWLLGIRPILFNGIYGSWFFHPYLGYPKAMAESADISYANYVHSAHDTFMAVAFPAVYLLYGINISLKWSNRGGAAAGTQTSSSTGGANVQRTVSQKHMFFQVAIISGFNCYACLLYVYMQYVDLNKTVAILASYGWFFIHGIPPVIYLTLNASIRRDCAKMVQKLCLSGDAIGIGGSTTAMGSQQQKQGGSGGGTSKCRVQVLGIRQQQQQQQHKLGGVGGKPGPKQPQQQSGGSRAQKPSAMRNFLQAHAQGAAIGSATC